MTHDSSGSGPAHEDSSPWSSPTDPPAQQSGGGAQGWSDPGGGAAGHPPPYTAGPASPWETAGTAAGAALPYGYPPPRRTNTMAIVAMALSIAGVATCITAPVGAILGHVSRRQIRESGEEGAGYALAAIIVGWAITAVLVILCGLWVGLMGLGFALSQQDPNL